MGRARHVFHASTQGGDVLINRSTYQVKPFYLSNRSTFQIQLVPLRAAGRRRPSPELLRTRDGILKGGHDRAGTNTHTFEKAARESLVLTVTVF